MKIVTENNLIKTGAMARRIGVPVKWLKDEAEAGTIPSLKAGKIFLFNPAVVESILMERANRRDEIESWIKAGLPNNDLWRISMTKEPDCKNYYNFKINYYNGVSGNIQTEILQNENNTNCNNYKDNKDVLKNRNIFQTLFAFIKISIAFLGLIKSFILKLL